MARLGPVAVSGVALLPWRQGSGTYTVTLPSNPTGPWTAKAVCSDGTELVCSSAKLTTGTRQLVVTADNYGVFSSRTITGIAVDY